VEPLSTTRAWYPTGKRLRTQGSAAASFKQGKITSIVMFVTLGIRPEPDQSGTLSFLLREVGPADGLKPVARNLLTLLG
jgi:hypothetical protein